MGSTFSVWEGFKRKKCPWLQYFVQTGAHEAGSSLAICACLALPWEFVLLDRSDTFPFVSVRVGCVYQCVWLPLEIVTRTAALQ